MLVVFGVDFVMILGVVMLVLDIFLEYVFVGLFWGDKIEVVKFISNDL